MRTGLPFPVYHVMTETGFRLYQEIFSRPCPTGLGAGRQLRDQHIMHKVGVGLIDRETGRLRSFAEGREESIAITSIGPDGGFYLATSPVRRAATRGLLGERVPPLVGGIQRYKPVRLDLLLRDAVCAAAAY